MKRNIVPDSCRTDIDSLVAEALNHLRSLGYSPKTVTHYRDTWNVFLRFAHENSEDETPFTDLIQRFLKNREITADEAKTQLMFHQRHIRTVMRVLTEFGLHRCIQRRGQVTKKIKLCPSMNTAILGYEQFCLKHLQSRPETMRTRKREITRFLHYLESHNVTGMTEVQTSMISQFMMSRAHLEPTTLARIASTLRSFLRYLCMQGVVSNNLAEQVPKICVRTNQRIPLVWSREDVDSLLAVVDRCSPCGKRDYAILLLAARLGLRASDIRTLRLEHLLWDQARIEKMQVKGGTPLSLPLTEEIGNALIDYLRNGRPQSQHREVFLRAHAPFEPVGDNNNLYHIITTYRRRACISLPFKSRKGLHSLRHTVASRLLEANVPIETISSVMGHLSTETTQSYIKIDIKALRSVAIDLEEVAHA